MIKRKKALSGFFVFVMAYFYETPNPRLGVFALFTPPG